MNAEGILQRIHQDASDAAATILREAQDKAEELRGVSEGKIAKGQQRAVEQAQQDALSLDDRMQRMAKLDARKAMLASKREVLDEAFAGALTKMQAMPAEQARAFGLSMLLDSATGKETLVADEASAWCDQAFVDMANGALKKAGKPGEIILSKEKRALGGGFVLTRDGMEINCSFPAALEQSRLEIEAEVASLLFES